MVRPLNLTPFLSTGEPPSVEHSDRRRLSEHSPVQSSSAPTYTAHISFHPSATTTTTTTTTAATTTTNMHASANSVFSNHNVAGRHDNGTEVSDDEHNPSSTNHQRLSSSSLSTSASISTGDVVVQEKQQQQQHQQQQQPVHGSRRIPCRARGLATTHNKQSAFFEIPYNAPHGLMVRCSRPECFGTDRGFRYCSVCRRQVAQRNFIRRHGHGILTSPEQLKELNDTSKTSKTPKSPSPTPLPSIHSSPPLTPVTTSTTTTTSEAVGCVVIGGTSYPYPTITTSTTTNNNNNKNTTTATTTTDGLRNTPWLGKHGQEQQQPPSFHHSTKTSFTNQSLPSSSPSKGPNSLSSASPVPESFDTLSEQDKAWLHLLHERPHVEDSNTMSQWVKKLVLHPNQPARNSPKTTGTTGKKSNVPSVPWVPSLPSMPCDIRSYSSSSTKPELSTSSSSVSSSSTTIQPSLLTRRLHQGAASERGQDQRSPTAIKNTGRVVSQTNHDDEDDNGNGNDMMILSHQLDQQNRRRRRRLGSIDCYNKKSNLNHVEQEDQEMSEEMSPFGFDHDMMLLFQQDDEVDFSTVFD